MAESAFTLERIGASGGFESELIYSRTPFHSRTPLTGRNDWRRGIRQNNRARSRLNEMAGPARGTPYNPLVADVMTAVFGPTAGEDRPQLHPRAQPAVQTLVSLADANPRFEAVRHACPSPFLSDASHAAVRLEWLRHHLSCKSRGSV